MSIHEDGEHAPPVNATRVFDGINLKWFGVRSADHVVAMPSQARSQLVSDYIATAAAYFTNHKDPYLREVGETAIHALSSNRVELFLTSDIAGSMRSRGADEEMCSDIEEDDKMVFVTNEEEGVIQTGNSTIFISPELIIEAKVRPLQALSYILSAFSGARDFVNVRTAIEPEMSQKRARATVAHFLHSAFEEYQMSSDDPDYQEAKGLLQEFPAGIDSLEGGRYQQIVSPDPRMN